MKECFAKSLGNCDPKMSKEHYLSDGILKLIGNSSLIGVAGFTWCEPGKLINVGKNSLQSKILCRKHNSELSNLDSIAITFFEFFSNLVDFEQGQKSLEKINKFIAIKGDLFERWLLKFVMGNVVSGNTKIGKFDINSDFANEYVGVLFGLKPWPKEQGLYLNFHQKKNISTKHIQADFMGNLNNNKITVILISFHGLPFVLRLFDFGKPLEELDKTNFAHQLKYHPSGIVLVRSSGMFEVKFDWPHGIEVGSEVSFLY